MAKAALHQAPGSAAPRVGIARSRGNSASRDQPRQHWVCCRAPLGPVGCCSQHLENVSLHRSKTLTKTATKFSFPARKSWSTTAPTRSGAKYRRDVVRLPGSCPQSGQGQRWGVSKPRPFTWAAECQVRSHNLALSPDLPPRRPAASPAQAQNTHRGRTVPADGHKTLSETD